MFPTQSRKELAPNANRRFTPVEDQKLQELVGQFGARRWRRIAQFMPGRTSRQCRDRYCNYLTPEFYNMKWTQEEDALLYQKFQELGSQWAKMTQFFPGKNANNIKNRWNYSVSKMKPSDFSNIPPSQQQQQQNQSQCAQPTVTKVESQIITQPILFVPPDICSLKQSSLQNNTHLETNEYEQKPRKLKPFPPISTLIANVPNINCF